MPKVGRIRRRGSDNRGCIRRRQGIGQGSTEETQKRHRRDRAPPSTRGVTSPMWTLSGFADEISPDLEEQCSVLDQLGIRFIEFRSAWGTNVLDLDDSQLEQARKTLDQHGIATSSVGSPIGKVKIDDDFDEHLRRFDRALEVAQRLEAPY